MFKKILLALVASALLLAAVGCACGPTTAPSPSPTMTMTASNSPELSASPGVSPDMSASPGVGDTPAMTIPDFKEGTAVDEEEVPEVAAAVKKKYPDGKIVSIKHAMQENIQVYAVELDNGGKTETVYVQPDGVLLEEGAGAGGTGTGGGTGGTGAGGSGGNAAG